MSIENWVSIGTVAINALSMFVYLIIMIKLKNKNTLETVANIAKTLPTYIKQAKNLLGTSASTTRITNFVLDAIKDDLGTYITKSVQKNLKKEIERCAVKQENE